MTYVRTVAVMERVVDLCSGTGSGLPGSPNRGRSPPWRGRAAGWAGAAGSPRPTAGRESRRPLQDSAGWPRSAARSSMLRPTRSSRSSGPPGGTCPSAGCWWPEAAWTRRRWCRWRSPGPARETCSSSGGRRYGRADLEETLAGWRRQSPAGIDPRPWLGDARWFLATHSACTKRRTHTSAERDRMCCKTMIMTDRNRSWQRRLQAETMRWSWSLRRYSRTRQPVWRLSASRQWRKARSDFGAVCGTVFYFRRYPVYRLPCD